MLSPFPSRRRAAVPMPPAQAKPFALQSSDLQLSSEHLTREGRRSCVQRTLKCNHFFFQRVLFEAEGMLFFGTGYHGNRPLSHEQHPRRLLDKRLRSSQKSQLEDPTNFFHSAGCRNYSRKTTIREDCYESDIRSEVFPICLWLKILDPQNVTYECQIV